MPDFMQGLAKGIEKSKSVVADAIEGVSKDMTINANAMMDQSNAKQTNAIMNITSLLAQYLPYLAKSLNIEWDTGCLLYTSTGKRAGARYCTGNWKR